MPFSLQYKPFILSEESVSKSQILPRNIYKITSYQYVDGTTKTLSGTKTSIVFAIGITTDKKLTCIKISDIKPDKFFKWFDSFMDNIQLFYQTTAPGSPVAPTPALAKLTLSGFALT